MRGSLRLVLALAVSVSAIGAVFLSVIFLRGDKEETVEDWSLEARALCWPRENEDAMNAVRAMNLPTGLDVAVGLGTEAAYSPDGKMIAFAGFQREVGYDLYLINRDGTGLKKLGVTTQTISPANPNWSPDGKSLVYESLVYESGKFNDPKKGIFTVKIDGAKVTQITRPGEGVFDTYPKWSPDGGQIAFLRYGYSKTDQGYTSTNSLISLVKADGTGAKFVDIITTSSLLDVLQISSYSGFQPAWSPDGKTLAFAAALPAVNGHTYWLYLVKPGEKAARALGSDERVYYPIWSKDGKMLTYSGKQNYSTDAHWLVTVATGAKVDVTERCLQEKYPRPQPRP